MRLIIDINEIAYKNVTYIPSIDWNGNLLRIVNDALQNGTPIPDNATVCDIEQIRDEIQENINYNKKMNYQGIVAGLLLTLEIIDKYKGDKE